MTTAPRCPTAELQLLLALPTSGSESEPPSDQPLATEQPLIALLRTAATALPARVTCLGLPAMASDDDCLLALQRAAEPLLVRGPLVLGGFSRGGRIAALCSPTVSPQPVGLLAWGFPFHRLGSPTDRHGLEALRAVTVPALIVQGSRDPHGNAQAIRGYQASLQPIPSQVSVHWIAHSKHRFASGQPCEQAVAAMLPFLRDFLVSPPA